MNRQLTRIQSVVFNQPWAIKEDYLDLICENLQQAINGGQDGQQVDAATLISSNNRFEELQIVSGVPVIPIRGVISRRMNLFSRISGGTSIEEVDKLFSEALSTDANAIVLDIDSPGGAVAGTPEFASRVAQARQTTNKTIVALADGMAASAAYWIGSQADDFFLTQASEVGSIGVIGRILDTTRARKNAGIDETIIRSSELKAPGAGPLTPQQLGSLQAKIMKFADLFKAAVAEGRGDRITDFDMATNGDTFIGQDAVRMGMADGISDMETIIRNFRKK